MMNWLFLLPLADISAAWKDTSAEKKLITAIVMVESSGNECATRFEPGWRHFLEPEKYARLVGTSVETERVHQATSWGLMQVMGTVARELGHTGPMVKLCDKQLGLKYGCLKIESLRKKYSKLEDVIAAYNAGSVVVDSSGNYRNSEYVLKVLHYYNQL